MYTPAPDAYFGEAGGEGANYDNEPPLLEGNFTICPHPHEQNDKSAYL